MTPVGGTEGNSGLGGLAVPGTSGGVGPKSDLNAYVASFTAASARATSADAVKMNAASILAGARQQLEDLASDAGLPSDLLDHIPPLKGNAGARPASISALLPADLNAYVNGLVWSGGYVDVGEVVRDALRRMRCDPCGDRLGLSVQRQGAGWTLGGPARRSESAVPASSSGEIDAVTSTLPPAARATLILRRLITLVERDIAANEGAGEGRPLELERGIGSERGYLQMIAPFPDEHVSGGWRLAPVRAVERGISDLAALRRVRDELQERLDAIDEAARFELQDLLATITRTHNMLSAVAEKLDEASRAIISSLA